MSLRTAGEDDALNASIVLAATMAVRELISADAAGDLDAARPHLEEARKLVAEIVKLAETDAKPGQPPER